MSDRADLELSLRIMTRIVIVFLVIAMMYVAVLLGRPLVPPPSTVPTATGPQSPCSCVEAPADGRQGSR